MCRDGSIHSTKHGHRFSHVDLQLNFQTSLTLFTTIDNYTQLNSTQPEITDAGVNTSKSASLCSYYFKKNIINL